MRWSEDGRLGRCKDEYGFGGQQFEGHGISREERGLAQTLNRYLRVELRAQSCMSKLPQTQSFSLLSVRNTYDILLHHLMPPPFQKWQLKSQPTPSGAQ